MNEPKTYQVRLNWDRYTQLRRILFECETLRRSRFGLTVADLIDATFTHQGERWGERTVYRDLVFLETCGMAERTVPGRWRWIGEQTAVATMSAERISPQTTRVAHWHDASRERYDARKASRESEVRA